MSKTTVTVFLLGLFGSWNSSFPFFSLSLSLILLHTQMWMILLGRQASTPFSHGLSQPIDQCKSKPVTSGHDILWLDFKCVYRSESLCTCRQKHWGRRLTHNARRFQLHLCICQGASELCPLWKQRAAQEHARPAAVWTAQIRSAAAQSSFPHSANSFFLHT